MKSVGEAMAIGRTFKQAYLKAIRSLEAPLAGHDVASFDPWFKRELEEIEAFRAYLSSNAAGRKSSGCRPSTVECQLPIDASLLRQAKVFGFSDKEIAAAIGSDEITVRTKRLELEIHPEFGEVDTCAGEFEAKTDAVLLQLLRFFDRINKIYKITTSNEFF